MTVWGEPMRGKWGVGWGVNAAATHILPSFAKAGWGDGKTQKGVGNAAANCAKMVSVNSVL